MLLMGKSTISMAIFNSFLYVYQRLIYGPVRGAIAPPWQDLGVNAFVLTKGTENLRHLEQRIKTEQVAAGGAPAAVAIWDSLSRRVTLQEMCCVHMVHLYVMNVCHEWNVCNECNECNVLFICNVCTVSTV